MSAKCQLCGDTGYKGGTAYHPRITRCTCETAKRDIEASLKYRIPARFTMTLPQKLVLRELLNLSIEHGFGCLYPLAPIAAKLGITEPLYDNNTNTGLLWEFGPHGDGHVYARGDWPDACASIDYDTARMIENWVHPKQQPVG